MLVSVSRAIVERKNAIMPGYRAAVEAIAIGSDSETYSVDAAAYAELVRVEPRGRDREGRNRVAIGDAVEKMLTAMGITKQRVQAWTRTKDCGCKARQKWLNQWGYRQQEKLERVLKKAARWYGIS